jgi:dolichol-phosphate mannosyltransferase
MLSDQHNLCVASRFAPGATIHGVGALRNGLSAAASRVLTMLFPVPGVSDYSSGYRAYRGALLSTALDRHGEKLIESKGFAVQVEILLKLLPLGLKGTEIPIDLQYGRKPTPSKARMLHTMVDLLGVMWRAGLSRGG